VEHKTDEQLVREHVAGAPDAFEVLVRRYAEDLFSFFHRFVGNAAAADDLVQETFLQVHMAAEAFDPKRRFKPWLYTIGANKARDLLRSRGRRGMQSLDRVGGDSDAPPPATLIEADGISAAAQLGATEQAEQVRAIIDEMPEHLRLVLVLGYYQRLPYAEIADILEIPVGTVKSRLHTAVNQFAKLWLARSRSSTPEG
jgi:RNA polymerase sigma-70 factor (ECF subfamily)